MGEPRQQDSSVGEPFQHAAQGPAFSLYQKNKLKAMIDSVMDKSIDNKNYNRSAALGFKYAIFGGDYEQCEKCYGYMKKGSLKKH